MKYKIFFPTANLEAFKKLALKVSKNVKGVSINIGTPYNKVFKHHCSEGGCIKMTHQICDIEIQFPDVNDWQLLASIEGEMLFITDPTKKLELLNPNHGTRYDKCDECGHWMKNSYIIRNVSTNRELQIGGECAKKYGINYLKAISGFVHELYEMYDFSRCYPDEDEEYPYWRGDDDKSAFMSIEAVDLFTAAKMHYVENKGKWSKGYYASGGYYCKSESANNIIETVITGVEKSDENNAYYKKVCEHIKNTVSCDSEFSCDMMRVCSDYYVCPSDGVYAFFAIKNYEEYMESKRLNLAPIAEGSLVKVSGRIISSKTREGYFGPYTIHEIKTNKGYTAYRTGTVPFTEANNEKLVDFYAFVKSVDTNGKLILDRALKHPKKGFEITQL